MTHTSATTSQQRGEWFRFSDDTLALSAVPSVQFYDVWSRSTAVSPERGLALAVMEQAEPIRRRLLDGMDT